MRIDPIARSTQRKTAFNQTCDENCAKAETADVGGFEDTQTTRIRCARQLRLGAETAAYLLDKVCQPGFRRLRAGSPHDLDRFNRGYERAAQRLQTIKVEHCLRQLGVRNISFHGPGNLLSERQFVEKPNQLAAQVTRTAAQGNCADVTGK